MLAIYHTTANELNFDFIEYLKKQFKGYSIDIIVKEQDETTYLNSSKKNKKYLEEAIEEVNKNKLIHKTPEELGI